MLYEEEKSKNVSEDTKLRFEIQKRIQLQVEEGKSILEIVQDLNSVEEYQKYSVYFPTWISDKMIKMQKKQSRDNKEEMEK